METITGRPIKETAWQPPIYSDDKEAACPATRAVRTPRKAALMIMMTQFHDCDNDDDGNAPEPQ